MNNLYNKSVLLLALIIIATSCTEVINIDVPNGGSRLVVEGSINWEKGTTGKEQVIKLSTSTAYFDTNANIAVLGASVKVINQDDGTQFVFVDQGNGDYLSHNFKAQLNQSYKLIIQYMDKTYSAIETLIPVADISKIEQPVVEGDSDEDFDLKIYFNDPADEHNYYLGGFRFLDGTYVSFEALDDSFTDGNQNYLTYESHTFDSGRVLETSLYGISEQYYNYIKLLLTQSEESDGPFQTTPAQLKGNCKNVEDSNEVVLGYFNLSEVVKKLYTIK